MEHIDEETLSAFIDNKLLGKSKTDVINHLRVCDECRLLMAETSTFLHELDNKQSTANTPSNEANGIGRFIPKSLQQYIVPIALAASIVLVIIPIMNISQDELNKEMLHSSSIQEETVSISPASTTSTSSNGLQKPEDEIESKIVMTETEEPVVTAAHSPTEENTVITTKKKMKADAKKARKAAESKRHKAYFSEITEKESASSTAEDLFDEEPEMTTAASYSDSRTDIETLTMNLPVIYFPFNSYELDHTSKEKVKHIVNIIIEEEIKSYSTIKLIGNSDDNISDEDSYDLGLKRASSVKQLMKVYGVDASKISTVSYGNTNPFCTDDTKECEEQNRRVEVKFLP